MTSSKRKLNRFRQSKRMTLTRPDWITVFTAISLSLFGLVMIFDASNIEGYYQFADKFHFVKLQSFWLILSLIVFLFTIIIPLNLVRRLSLPFFIASVILLVIVLIPGIGSKLQGARRWIYFGSFSIQPSELAKLSAAIYFPALLAKTKDLLPFILLTFILLVLLMLEPDLGTSIIIMGIAFGTYFFAGASLKKFIPIVFIMLLLGSVLVLSSNYRRQRLVTFFNPTDDPLGASYHVRQVLISLGSGGITGTGIGKSRQKFQYLPEATTDSIFAVTAEEVGFIGASTIILMYALIYVRGFHQTSKINQSYPQLLSAAILSWLSLQTIMNLAAMVVLVPLTGVPLPFVSYGGSALMTALAGLGLYANASRYRVKD